MDPESRLDSTMKTGAVRGRPGRHVGCKRDASEQAPIANSRRGVRAATRRASDRQDPPRTSCFAESTHPMVSSLSQASSKPYRHRIRTFRRAINAALCISVPKPVHDPVCAPPSATKGSYIEAGPDPPKLSRASFCHDLPLTDCVDAVHSLLVAGEGTPVRSRRIDQTTHTCFDKEVVR